MRWLLIVGCAFMVMGCGSMPRVRIGKVEASAPKDTGKPATVASNVTTTEVPIPEGSTLEEVVASNFAADDYNARPLRLTFSKPTALRIVQENQTATSGTVDTSVAVRRADNAARQPLLFASIGAMIGAAAFLFLKYPTPALMCGAASVVFFIAWQAAGLPAWFWVIGAVSIAGGITLWIGHERGEKAAK